jgi:hypothetical protein
MYDHARLLVRNATSRRLVAGETADFRRSGHEDVAAASAARPLRAEVDRRHRTGRVVAGRSWNQHLSE